MSGLERNPEVRRANDARTSNQLAGALLRCSDFTVLKYAFALSGAVRRLGFEAGAKFIAARTAILIQERDEAGALPHQMAHEAEALREILARHAAEPEATP